MAIANVTPEQLDSSLPEVTAGLAVAFDTTAQALTMSMLLVFATFLVERGEQSILNDVEQFGIDSLVPFVGELMWMNPKRRPDCRHWLTGRPRFSPSRQIPGIAI